ncbi:hypothetical protein ACVIHH_002064 [Bradyrhizobium sp. USDA 4518]
MKRERLNLQTKQAERPRQRKPFRFAYKPESPEQREARKAADRKRSYKRRCRMAAPKSWVPADPTFIRLLETVTLRRNQQDDAAAMLSSYLATGTTRRTIIRERLPARVPHPEK